MTENRRRRRKRRWSACYNIKYARRPTGGRRIKLYYSANNPLGLFAYFPVKICRNANSSSATVNQSGNRLYKTVSRMNAVSPGDRPKNGSVRTQNNPTGALHERVVVNEHADEMPRRLKAASLDIGVTEHCCPAIRPTETATDQRPLRRYGNASVSWCSSTTIPAKDV